MSTIFQQLRAAATEICKEIRFGEDRNAGTVAAALQTQQGDIFSGICMHLCCGIGVCAEHAAVLEMLKARQTRILKLVAVSEGGTILSPCGRCRELFVQVDAENLAMEVLLPGEKIISLKDLLPFHWMEERQQ